jgi:hypothetical protein
VILLGLRYEQILAIDLAVDHMLHFLKPAKFMLHLCYLGHSQRPPFLSAARQLGQPIEEAVRICEFVSERRALSCNLGGRLVVLAEELVARVQEPDDADDPVRIRGLVYNQIDCAEHRSNHILVIVQAGSAVSNFTQNLGEHILRGRLGQLVRPCDLDLLRTPVSAQPHSLHPLERAHRALLAGHEVAIQHHRPPVVSPGPDSIVDVAATDHC